MPTSGWTAGLVGRRDALLLVLVAAGVPYTAIERLHRRDPTVDDNRCLVVTLPTTVVRILAAPADPRTCPVAVYLRWARLLTYYERYPSAIALAEALRAAQPVEIDSVERYQSLPVLPRDGRDPLMPIVNRWGQFGAPQGCRGTWWGMGADSIAGVVNAHLGGTAALRFVPFGVEKPDTVGGEDHQRGAARPLPPVRRDGAAQRRRDAEQLSDLGGSFDEIERRAAYLAAWIGSLIESAVGDATREVVDEQGLPPRAAPGAVVRIPTKVSVEIPVSMSVDRCV